MKIKYSILRKELGFEKANGEVNGLAFLTHYLQSDKSGKTHYEKTARDYYHKLLKEPEANYRLPFVDYDVPFPPPKESTFKFIDLFAGIGGFRIALQEQNGTCVFSSEWDKYAKKTYEANFGEVPFDDITKVSETDIPDHDILTAGFPCQPFSLAGVSKKNSLGRSHGFDDKTQGTLFFDVKRIISTKRPKAFILENVKNLVSHDKGNTFEIIRESLREELDYEIFFKVIDAKGLVPQHRERIFIIGFDRKRYTSPVFTFPTMVSENQPVIGDILERKVDPKYTLTDKLWKYLRDYAAKHKAKGNGFGYSLVDLYGTSRTLSARYHKDGSEILIPQGSNKNPRRLTPSECKKLMGYPKNYCIDDIGVSDTQLYRQFGNSVAVPVVLRIAEAVVDHLKSLDLEKRTTTKKKPTSAYRLQD